MNIRSFIEHMPEVDAYQQALRGLSERWNLLTLLGQMSNIGMDMTETREGFQNLTDRLLERLGNETLQKLTSEMEAKAQVAVDIVIRNLFERTADIGFLATDDDLRHFLVSVARLQDSDEDRDSRRRLRERITERFREYVAKYSVYSNIILLNPEGMVLAQLDGSNPVERSADPLIQEAIGTNREYVEIYRHSDLQPRQANALIYAYRVTQNNDPKSEILGVLCLVFRFENEMEGVFGNLIEAEDWMEITLLDQDGRVISSSDPYHIPIGAKLPKVLDQEYQAVRFAGREYLATTRATQGYEGFTGLGWYGHVMVPLDSAFRKLAVEHDEQQAPRIEESLMQRVVAASRLFSDDLVDIPLQADRIQRELDVTVWNGNVQIANTKSGDNSFSKSLLNEISHTGARTKQVFEDSISNLNQTVISSFLDDAAFHASLAVDIMDRNLYERANDCRWWALTSRFRDILAQDRVSDAERQEISDILGYINNLYTVYTNLFVYDRHGTIQAVSNPGESRLVGQKLSEQWVTKTLGIRNSQEYSVSPFAPTPLYEQRATYIYGASITHRERGEVLGGIGIVFDSLPQFQQMLLDALPKNEKGEVAGGCFGVFADRNKSVISSTSERFGVGDPLSLPDRLFRLGNGQGCSDILQLDNHYYVVGARMSAGYREYKVHDRYVNDVVALVFMEIGETGQLNDRALTVRNVPFQYPRIQGSEKTVELSTFLIEGRLFAMESSSIMCSLNGQEITPILGGQPQYLGVISFLRHTVPVVSLRALLDGKDGYDKGRDSIIIVDLAVDEADEESDRWLGLVIDRVQDSPEVPVRCLDTADNLFRSKNDLVRYVVQPEPGQERSEMLSVIDARAVYRTLVAGTETSKAATATNLLPSGMGRDSAGRTK